MYLIRWLYSPWRNIKKGWSEKVLNDTGSFSSISLYQIVAEQRSKNEFIGSQGNVQASPRWGFWVIRGRDATTGLKSGPTNTTPLWGLRDVGVTLTTRMNCKPIEDTTHQMRLV